MRGDLRLVNQLLDFQKLEAGKKAFALNPSISIASPMLGRIISRRLAQAKPSTSCNAGRKTLDPELVVLTMGETDSLAAAFNFLSNALKYTPRGGRIEPGLKPQQRIGEALRPGLRPCISEEGQVTLFQVFSQAEGG